MKLFCVLPENGDYRWLVSKGYIMLGSDNVNKTLNNR